MRDELTDEQRARLCVLEVLIDVTDVQISAFDLLHFGHWVEHGNNPADSLRDLPTMAIPAPPRINHQQPWTPAVQ